MYTNYRGFKSAAAKAEGSVKLFGKYLATWIFALAALIVLGVATAPLFGGRPFGMSMMRGQGMQGMMPGQMMDGMMRGRGMQGLMGGGEEPSLPSATPPQPAPEAEKPSPN